MGTGSYFTAKRQGENTAFSVFPAPYPGALQANILMIGGLIIMIAPMIIYFDAVVASIPFGLLFFGPGYYLYRKRKKENDSRMPIEILAGKEVLHVRGQSFDVADIAGLIYGHKDSDATSGFWRGEVIVVDDSIAGSIGRGIRDNTEHAQHDVSYQVKLRLKSDSRPITLASGLTAETARSLSGDIAKALDFG